MEALSIAIQIPKRSKPNDRLGPLTAVNAIAQSDQNGPLMLWDQSVWVWRVPAVRALGRRKDPLRKGHQIRESETRTGDFGGGQESKLMVNNGVEQLGGYLRSIRYAVR
eukprot:4113780-Amphidinium_carterae.1